LPGNAFGFNATGFVFGVNALYPRYIEPARMREYNHLIKTFFVLTVKLINLSTPVYEPCDDVGNQSGTTRKHVFELANILRSEVRKLIYNFRGPGLTCLITEA
jgi:hypothetical protein